ncbi:MAG: gamma-glutamyl-gamma-aminobutyrate hydrolase family protein [Oscillospiraceae bacterium]|nr:gamma-glutamyl-gamma-aminobutyrate hydrolase family protein [Oscillospiraceae bacterium]
MTIKRILFTQRVDVVDSYNERRDGADQNVAHFLRTCGFLPIPICNIPELMPEYLRELKPDGILLTGGNDLHKYGGTAPERDHVERLLFQTALENNLPLLGLCRGMQIIADCFEVTLEKVENHVATRHLLHGKINREVNSYHKYGIYKLPKDFEILAHTEDGVVEALRHKSSPIMGIMWHPEREKPFSQEDMKLVRTVFGGEE